ncbi:asparaginase [Chloroflexota bacterium]
MSSNHQPIFEVFRAGLVESTHFGSIVAVDSNGKTLFWYGDPYSITYLRSSSKPIQVIPFIEANGDQHYHLTSQELAITCGSHDGSNEHIRVIQDIQKKVGIGEEDLLCGVQPPLDVSVADQLKERGETLTQNRHNCSGKHTAMLAFAAMSDLPDGSYINPNHPIQHKILDAVAGMCNMQPSQVIMGIDGCSVPTFAVPLYNAALAYARLCDPKDLAEIRSAACRRITTAMLSNPEMVAGPRRFDTRLMQVGRKRILAKAGAEGFFSIGLSPRVLNVDSPGIGIAIKVSDGDQKNRVRPALVLEILKQMKLLNLEELETLKEFGPTLKETNWRNLIVGESKPIFNMETGDETILDGE